MSKHYYISADGGGTKLVSILYDDEFNLLAVGRSGSVNQNFETDENVRLHMADSIRQCLDGRNISCLEVGSCAMAGPIEMYREELLKQVEVKSFVRYEEGAIPLLAGIQKREGAVALSGTGSDVFFHKDGKLSFLGGWGSLLGDDGSGYTIGRDGIRAALFDIAGYGEKTMLSELAISHYGVERKDAMAVVGKIYKAPAPREYIASFCKKVSKAAHQGDEQALRILSEAGIIMANQILAIIKRDNVPSDIDVVISGGAWKSHPIMFESFKKELLSVHPALCVSRPLFDPVVGPVIDMALGDAETIDENLMEKLKSQFDEFICDKVVL